MTVPEEIPVVQINVISLITILSIPYVTVEIARIQYAVTSGGKTPQMQMTAEEGGGQKKQMTKWRKKNLMTKYYATTIQYHHCCLKVHCTNQIQLVITHNHCVVFHNCPTETCMPSITHARVCVCVHYVHLYGTELQVTVCLFVRPFSISLCSAKVAHILLIHYCEKLLLSWDTH